jgi:serine/threonine-protein kinase RsbW
VRAQQIIFRLTMASTPKNIGRIEKFLAKISRSVPMDEIQLHKLMVSLTEAVNNAIIHGNKADPRKKVAIQCELLPGWLLIMVNDEGRGFKPEGVKNPLKKENLMRENGRGIFLMRTLMDRVEFGKIKSGHQVRLWLDLKK